MSISDKNKVDEKTVLNKVLEKTSVIKKEITVQKKDNIVEKKESAYELFEKLLNALKYEEALNLYSNETTNDTLEQFQAGLFYYIQEQISQENLTVLALVTQFLEIEYDHPYGLYFKSQIDYLNGNIEEAITILYSVKIYDLEKDLEYRVTSLLSDYTTVYIQGLLEGKDFKKLIPFLQNIIQEDSSETKYIYLLAVINFDLKNYNSSKELLEQILYDETYANKAKSMIDKINRAQRFSQKIQLEKKGIHFYIKALLNDQIEVNLLLDTGATVTLIDESIINTLEHTVLDEKVKMNTAGGVITAKHVQLNSFSIQNNSIDKMKMISSPLKNRDFDGLLGMNYLKEFDFYIDQENSILYLNQK